jgi:hypothetical protein
LAVSIISGVLATIFLIGAIVGLYWVHNPNAKLGMLSGLTVAFAGSLALFTNARRQDVFAATAAYAAVLVVFVSGNLATSSPATSAQTSPTLLTSVATSVQTSTVLVTATAANYLSSSFTTETVYSLETVTSTGWDFAPGQPTTTVTVTAEATGTSPLPSDSASRSTGLSDHDKIALGAGLGIGLPFLILLLLACCCW